MELDSYDPMVYFSYFNQIRTESEILQHHNRRATPAQLEEIKAAWQRFIANPAESFSYPWLENKSPKTFSSLKQSFPAFEPGRAGVVYQMVPAIPEPPPETLPGAPRSMRWVAGRGLVPADEAPPLRMAEAPAYKPGVLSDPVGDRLRRSWQEGIINAAGPGEEPSYVRAPRREIMACAFDI